MATQEEWRKIAHLKHIGETTGNSSGTIWGAQGARKFVAAQKERLANERALKESTSRMFNSKATAVSFRDTALDTPREARRFDWKTSNTVVFLGAFVAGFLYLRYYDRTDLAIALIASFVASWLVGRYYKTLLLVGVLCAVSAAAFLLYSYFHR